MNKTCHTCSHRQTTEFSDDYYFREFLQYEKYHCELDGEKIELDSKCEAWELNEMYYEYFEEDD